MAAIDEFRGDYRFLSNFYLSPFPWEGFTVASVEHAYQAAKAEDLAERKKIVFAKSPGLAKKLGNRVMLRADWDEVKIGVTRELLALKFAPRSSLAKRLLATGNAHLVEGNHWGDQFWGVCDGVGENHLGRLLVERRDHLLHPASSATGWCLLWHPESSCYWWERNPGPGTFSDGLAMDVTGEPQHELTARRWGVLSPDECVEWETWRAYVLS
nr:NADAR family protein [Rhizobium cremeum]